MVPVFGISSRSGCFSWLIFCHLHSSSIWILLLSASAVITYDQRTFHWIKKRLWKTLFTMRRSTNGSLVQLHPLAGFGTADTQTFPMTFSGSYLPHPSASSGHTWDFWQVLDQMLTARCVRSLWEFHSARCWPYSCKRPYSGSHLSLGLRPACVRTCTFMTIAVCFLMSISLWTTVWMLLSSPSTATLELYLMKVVPVKTSSVPLNKAKSVDKWFHLSFNERLLHSGATHRLHLKDLRISLNDMFQSAQT